MLSHLFLYDVDNNTHILHKLRFVLVSISFMTCMISFCNGIYALCLFVAMFISHHFYIAYTFNLIFSIKRNVDYKVLQ